jgi:hypothetical protein
VSFIIGRFEWETKGLLFKLGLRILKQLQLACFVEVERSKSVRVSQRNPGGFFFWGPAGFKC